VERGGETTWIELGLGQKKSNGTEWTGEGVTAAVESGDEAGFDTIRLSLTLAPGSTPVRLLDWVWHIDGVPAALDRVWHMTFNCWGMPAMVTRESLAHEPEQHACSRAAFYDADTHEGLSFVYRMPSNWVHVIETDDANGVTLTTRIDADLQPGETWRDDELAIRWGKPETDLGGPTSFHISRRRRDEMQAHGAWNSWDYYRLDVRADDIRENLEVIRSNETLREFVKYIIIDDGWQTLDGEWEANEKFPGGMEAIAAEIREAGFIPGIWTAAFMVNCRSSIFSEHPDWFIQYEGKPGSAFANKGCTGVWGERYFLDPTHPATVEHLERLYTKLRGWGYGYFKTDFLTNCFTAQLGEYLPDRGQSLTFHDHSQGLLVPHRRCMEAIRRAIGPESFWLGCGSVWATGAGLMDGSRTTGDISPYWRNLLICARTAFFNGHAHGRVFLNDPDFLVVRGLETNKAGMLDVEDADLVTATPGNHRSGPMFTAAEARMWASLVLLSGGIVTMSDRMGALNEVGMEIVEKTCRLASESSGEPAFPLDWHQEMPTSALRDQPEAPMLGLFNWSEESLRPLTTDLPGAYAEMLWEDVWTGRRLRSAELREVVLEPHHGMLLMKA